MLRFIAGVEVPDGMDVDFDCTCGEAASLEAEPLPCPVHAEAQLPVELSLLVDDDVRPRARVGNA